MKKVIALFLIAVLCLSLIACTKTYSSVDDYQIIYDNVKNVNDTLRNNAQKDSLLEFDEYTYCSYLLLFPRQTPNNLTDFEYNWMQVIDYDSYFIYFTYKLNEDEFSKFKKSLSEFEISYNNQTKKPVYTETHFEYPTYILSWTTDAEHGGTCEYVMLDASTNTVINVYKMGNDMKSCQKKAQYNISPNNNDFDGVEELCGSFDFSIGTERGFSVYSFLGDDNKLFAPELESLSYDNSFLRDV